jgi:hypothetical protein
MAEHSETERRHGERRQPEDRRVGVDRRRHLDRQIAQRLPDEFAQAGGGAIDRITGLINRHWAHRSGSDRADLAEALLPILGELLEPGTPVTDEHRHCCEQVVTDWVRPVPCA